MKAKMRVLIVVVTLVATAATVAASSPYLIDPFWMADPLDPGQPAPDPGTPPETDVPGYWWRDTANQNAIAQHSEDAFAGQVIQVYRSNVLDVLVYNSDSGPNVAALIGGDDLVLVGPGGGRNEANAAKIAFQASYSGFTNKHLLGIVVTEASPEAYDGAQYWRSIFRQTPPAPIYANASFAEAKADLDAVATEYAARQAKALGQSLAWGADGFLGAGSMKAYNPQPSYAGPTILISEPTLLDTGVWGVYLIPTSGEDAGLIMYALFKSPRVPGCSGLECFLSSGTLEQVPMLFLGDAGPYLPDVGSIYRANVSVQERIAILDQILTNQFLPYPLTESNQPDYLFTAHGLPVIQNHDAILSALTAQRDALQAVYDQTLVLIDQGYTIDEIAAAVALPPELAGSAYTRELASTLPGVVRNIYHEKMGWFGGETHELASTLTPNARAEAIAEAMGGVQNLVAAARQAELSARDLASAEQALYLAEAAYRAAPDDFAAKQIYAQTLRKNAYMQKSAQTRNYYLTVAQELGTDYVVTDLAKSGDEDTALAFTAAEFSQHFGGIPGASLGAVKIVSLPPAEHGTLSLAGVDVVAEQEIAVTELDGLAFIPAANWHGETSFTWNGKDGDTYAAADATVTITIAPLNDAPVVAAPLADVIVDEDAAGMSIDLAPAFTDVDGDALAYTVENGNPALLSAAVEGASLTLAFLENQNGEATVTVTASDPSGASATDNLIVTVNPVNDAPWAKNAEVYVIAGTSQEIALDYGDVETGQGKLIVTASPPTKGTLSGTAPTLSYTPNAGYIGDDSFTFTVDDLDGGQAQAGVQIHVVVMASISGQVYHDANGNGVQDEGEGGLADVSLSLLDAGETQAGKTLTAADGTYVFPDLTAGTYRVQPALINGYVQTTPDPGEIVLADWQTFTGVDLGAVVSADLGVTMTAGVDKKAIIYTIVVANDGPADAAGAVLSGAIPDGTAFVSASTSLGTCSGGKTLTCEFGTMAPGSSAIVTLKVNRNSKDPIVATMMVNSSIFDIDPGDNTVTVTVE